MGGSMGGDCYTWVISLQSDALHLNMEVSMVEGSTIWASRLAVALAQGSQWQWCLL
jgi:hypothetical protein